LFFFILFGIVEEFGRLVMWELPPEYHYLKSDSRFINTILGILGFYVIDFLRYWAHRIGHNKPFYKTYPFARKFPTFIFRFPRFCDFISFCRCTSPQSDLP
jgi:hypothetical protein